MVKADDAWQKSGAKRLVITVSALARAGRVDGESEVVGVKFHPFVSEGLDAVAVGGKGGATVVAFGVDGSEFVAFAQGEAIVGTVSASRR